MSGPVNTFDAALAGAVMEALRVDDGVKTYFGNPPRLFDDESPEPIYPYAELLSSEAREFSSAATPTGEHRLTFALRVCHGGHTEAARGLSALVEAVQSADIMLPGARIILAHPVYLDVMRGKLPYLRRGLLRLRIVTEQETNP